MTRASPCGVDYFLLRGKISTPTRDATCSEANANGAVCNFLMRAAEDLGDVISLMEATG